jgi:hypothetical protein
MISTRLAGISWNEPEDAAEEPFPSPLAVGDHHDFPYGAAITGSSATNRAWRVTTCSLEIVGVDIYRERFVDMLRLS